MTRKPWLRRAVSFLLIAGAFAFLIREIVRNLDALRGFDWHLRPGLLLLSLAALVGVLVAGVGYWAIVLRSFGIEAPLVPLARTWFLANLSRYIPGMVWQFVSLAQFGGAAGMSAVVSITSLLVQMGFMLLSAALNTILFRYTGQRSILVGVPMANRNRLELEGLVGLLFNQLVLRSDLSDELTFRELLADTKSRLMGVFAHQDLPFEHLVQELRIERDMSRNPVFQVLFAFQNVPPSKMSARGLVLSRYEVRETTSREDLELDMRETPEGLAGWFGYDARLFDATTVERLRRQFCALLEAVAADPDRPIGAIGLMPSAERHQVLAEWNDTDRGDPLAETVQKLWEARVAEHPDAPAVTWRGRTRSYGEVDRRANRLAWRLVGRGVGSGVVVGLLAERSDDFLAAMLAVWKAGGAYLPLDPVHPPHRHRQVLEQSRSPLVLADESLAPALTAAVEPLEAGRRPEVLGLSTLLEAEGRQGPPPCRVTPRDLAYVIFTSGSTGAPKGAMVEQRGMVNHLRAKVEDLGLGRNDLTAQTASQCFDISVWQYVAPLVSGGRVIVYGDELTHEPARLLERTEADGVTVLETVPSMLRLMLLEAERREDERPELARLRWMISTGEALPPELSRRWRLAYPRVPLFNAYGPTECSDDVTHQVIARRAGDGYPREPIGKPVRQTRLYVVDRSLQPTPAGVPGELLVGGPGVGRGYLHDPHRTAPVFVPDPFGDGARAYRTGDRARWLLVVVGASLGDVSSDAGARQWLDVGVHADVVTQLCSYRVLDAVGNLVHWAATGERTPMYASPEQRNTDIDAGGSPNEGRTIEHVAPRELDGLPAGHRVVLPHDPAQEVVRGSCYRDGVSRRRRQASRRRRRQRRPSFPEPKGT